MRFHLGQWSSAVLALQLVVPLPTYADEPLLPPFNMTVVSHLPGVNEEVWAEGDYAYVTGTTGIDIVDISDPAAPFVAAHYASGAKDVQVVDGLMYLQGEVVDVRDPLHPVHLTNLVGIVGGQSCHTFFYAKDPGFAYCSSAGTQNTLVWDLSTYNPDSAPATIPYSFQLTHADHDVVVVGSVFYGAGGSVELTPSHTIAGTYPAGGHSQWPTADHEFVVTTSESETGAVSLVDLEWTGLQLTSAVAVDTFSTSGGGGLVYPVPGNPTIEYGSAHNPVVSADDYAFVSFFESGVKVLKIDRLDQRFTLAASYDTSTVSFPSPCCSAGEGAYGVYPIPDSRLVLVTDQQTGLWILRHFSLEEAASLATHGVLD